MCKCIYKCHEQYINNTQCKIITNYINYINWDQPYDKKNQSELECVVKPYLHIHICHDPNHISTFTYVSLFSSSRVFFLSFLLHFSHYYLFFFLTKRFVGLLRRMNFTKLSLKISYLDFYRNDTDVIRESNWISFYHHYFFTAFAYSRQHSYIHVIRICMRIRTYTLSIKGYHRIGFPEVRRFICRQKFHMSLKVHKYLSKFSYFIRSLNHVDT